MKRRTPCAGRLAPSSVPPTPEGDIMQPGSTSLSRTLLTAALCAAATLGARDAWSAEKQPSLDVPYVPTPQAVVDKMLELGDVSADDYVIDLGSGDGRIPV